MAESPPSSPVPIAQALEPVPPEQVEHFCFQVLEEFLMQKGLHNTLQAFLRERPPSEDAEQSMASWYDVAQHIGLMDMIAAQPRDELDVHSATAPSPELQFTETGEPVYKERRNMSSTMEILVTQLLSEESKKLRQPISVVLRPEAASTSSIAGKRRRLRSEGGSVTDPAGRSLHESDAMSHSVSTTSMSFSRGEAKPPAPRDQKPAWLMLSAPKRQVYAARSKSEPMSQQAPQHASGHRGRKKKKQSSSAMLYKTDRNQQSNENWMPETARMRMLRRALSVTQSNWDDIVVRREAVEREMRKYQSTELQLEKTLERLGTKHQLNCALCEQKYSQINLPLTVSLKAVQDLRATWSHKYGRITMEELEKTRKRVPRCYDEVGVCRFCAQFFDEQSKYRPSPEQTRQEARMKHMAIREQRAAEYWDPLEMLTREREALDKHAEELAERGRTATADEPAQSATSSVSSASGA